MTLYYLDSTAWLQYYIRQTGSDTVAAFFTPSTILACSSFGLTEIVVALSRMAYSGTISHEDLAQKIHDVQNDWTQFLQVHLSSRLTKLIESVALKHNLSSERTLHLASAILVREHVQRSGLDIQTHFASADTELLNVAVRYDFTPIDVSAQAL
ncbi:MAG: type II toxin-antitoxin system VapC family toxin [Bacteroidota bacterium]|nr:type II toxin-antitoxin system VapC family toxin [Candidatus Kapabacteria bacterium]MDW8219762.1 type II toxin-antitoxin system VapC family toxin [Bacteroidota bacterium]